MAGSKCSMALLSEGGQVLLISVPYLVLCGFGRMECRACYKQRHMPSSDSVTALEVMVRIFFHCMKQLFSSPK